ncbi:hypothetical protein [Moraxella marmotae]|uniref:hypothetical protein n=1 Tax=Moraxella marmotae TaxID=3344520 RepID=UPI003673206A
MSYQTYICFMAIMFSAILFYMYCVYKLSKENNIINNGQEFLLKNIEINKFLLRLLFKKNEKDIKNKNFYFYFVKYFLYAYPLMLFTFIYLFEKIRL